MHVINLFSNLANKVDFTKFLPKIVRVNFHTVQCGNYAKLHNGYFGKNFVKENSRKFFFSESKCLVFPHCGNLLEGIEDELEVELSSNATNEGLFWYCEAPEPFALPFPASEVTKS